MNWKRPGNQLRGSCIGNFASAIFACLLLLAGCANPPQAAHPSVETIAPGAPSSVTQEAAIAKPAAPAASTEPSATGGEPVLTFEKNLHDFGEIGPQSRSVCEFRFQNTGTGVLEVRKKIDSTCGCTAAVLSQTEYAPGEQGTIQVTYSAGGALGATAKNITVYSNDQSHGGQVTVTIKATVVERVVHEPRQLHLGFKGLETGCPPLTLRSVDHRSFAITRIVSSGGVLTADVDPSVQATEFTLRPTLDAEQLQKHPMGTLLLTLTHPECTEISIPFQTTPEFQFTPPSLVLFDAEPNRPLLRDVWLSNNYAEEFEIVSCTSADDRVTVLEREKVVAPGQKGVRYRLRVSIQPPAAPRPQGVFVDMLTIGLADGTALRLACRVFYRGPQGSSGTGPL